MAGRRLLDTNAVIAFFRRDRAIHARMEQLDECFMSTIVVGELLYGALHSSRATENIARVESFAMSVTVLPCDLQSAAEYGRIKHELRLNGTPIPENDIWIASVAAQHNLTVLSNDKHFDLVAQLQREGW